MGWIRSRIGNGPSRKAHGPFHSGVTFLRNRHFLSQFGFEHRIFESIDCFASSRPNRLCCGRPRAFAMKGKTAGATGIDTPTKAAIVRDFNLRGGVKVRGAATATAKKFKLSTSSGASMVKTFDRQVRDNDARRKHNKAGRKNKFTDAIAGAIQAAFKENGTSTYAEVGEKIGLPKKTLHNYATKKMDFRRLGHKVRDETPPLSTLAS